jgi:general secretion pathway protein A
MDRIWRGTDRDGDRAQRSPGEVFTLPSRAEAVVALRSTLEAQAGPVLVTGEPGVGKTWLCRRLEADLPPPWRWVVVDIPPAIDATAFYDLIGHSLGLPHAGGEAPGRLALVDFLREAASDGVRVALVIDEAQNASVAVLEEIRLLANRLGRRDGVAALVLVGQTALARRLAGRPERALAVRLAAHLHLRTLDIEESQVLLSGLVPTLDWNEYTLEQIHRDARGNPGLMLRAARGARPHTPATEAARTVPRLPERRHPGGEPLPPPDHQDAWENPELGSNRPPLMVGDGMIEVGWEPSRDSEASVMAPAPPSGSAPEPSAHLKDDDQALRESGSDSASMPEVGVETVETINDHYAALQAWNEWARNQGRGALVPKQDAAPTPGPSGQPSVWRDAQQGFAPYGQLFSRQRQIRDPNESS